MSVDVGGNGNGGSTTHEAHDEHEDADLYLRTEFLERVAHELRGPSGVTLGAIDEMELLLGEDSEKVKPLLSMARRGIRRGRRCRWSG